MIIAKKKLGDIVIKRFNDQVYVYNAKTKQLLNKHTFYKDENFKIEYYSDKKCYILHSYFLGAHTQSKYNLEGKIVSFEKYVNGKLVDDSAYFKRYGKIVIPEINKDVERV